MSKRRWSTLYVWRKLFVSLCFQAADSAPVIVIEDDDDSSSLNSDSDSNMVSNDGSLRSVVSVDTNSSIHLGSSSHYSSYSDESFEGFEG